MSIISLLRDWKLSEPAYDHQTQKAKFLASIAATPQPKESTMAFSFASIGHAIASGLHDVYTGAKAVEKFIAGAATPANQAEIESLTALIPGVGPQAVVIERGVFAVAGQVAAILNNGTTSGETALLNAGFDESVIADFKALIAAVPGLVKGTTPAVKAA